MATDSERREDHPIEERDIPQDRKEGNFPRLPQASRSKTPSRRRAGWSPRSWTSPRREVSFWRTTSRSPKLNWSWPRVNSTSSSLRTSASARRTKPSNAGWGNRLDAGRLRSAQPSIRTPAALRASSCADLAASDSGLPAMYSRR